MNPNKMKYREIVQMMGDQDELMRDCTCEAEQDSTRWYRITDKNCPVHGEEVL